VSSPIAIVATPQVAAQVASPSAQSSALHPNQASHTYRDYLHHLKSLLIPSKSFLVSIKAQLPPCFAQQRLAYPCGAGTTGRVKAEQDWPCLWTGLSLRACASALISWLIQTCHNLGVWSSPRLPQNQPPLLSPNHISSFPLPLIVSHPIPATALSCFGSQNYSF